MAPPAAVPRWEPADVAAGAQPDWQGLFVLDGLLLRRVSAAGRDAGELLGAGDLFRPWDEDGASDLLRARVEFRALAPVRVAVLDGHFSQRVARWPTTTAQLIGRTAARARYLSLMQAVMSLRRTHARLLLLFWLVSERWGHVTADGVSVTLPISHELLAMLVGCHRLTVTIALQRLAREELLVRGPDNVWLLTPTAPEYLRQPDRLSELTASFDDGPEDERAGGPALR